METAYKIYTQKEITNPDGTKQNVLNQIGSATREELVKARDNVIVQRNRMEELVTIATRKVELVDLAGENDYIIL